MNPKPKTPKTFVIHTSAEVDAFERATADGAHGRNYHNNDQRGARIHQTPGHSHLVQIQLTTEELAQGVMVDTLEQLTVVQDADSIFAFLYISQLLAPVNPQGIEMTKKVQLDLDDVIEKIGWTPRNTKHRQELRRRVWQLIYFGSRAEVIGERKGQYWDRMTGEKIDTDISTSPWSILKKEWASDRADQRVMFAEEDVPLRVELTVSTDWAKLLSSPATAQYLPLGEVLGAIPGAKPSGAWARVIGLALANFWRREPGAALDGSIKPKRSELLERFPPKTGPVGEILDGNVPGRAIEYWHGALAILCEQGFIECFGEASLTLEEMRQKYPRKGWKDEWLDEPVEIRPGQLMAAAIHGRLVAPKPRKRAPRARKD